MNSTEAHSSHRWSGWPGAICQDCWTDDPWEYCLAEHDVLVTCSCGAMGCLDANLVEGHTLVLDCPDHLVQPCPCPASRDGDA